MKGLVLSGLNKTVTTQLAPILQEINHRSALTYLSLSENKGDYLPLVDATSQRFGNLSRLLIGGLALRYNDLVPYFGSRLRRLELTYFSSIGRTPLYLWSNGRLSSDRPQL